MHWARGLAFVLCLAVVPGVPNIPSAQSAQPRDIAIAPADKDHRVALVIGNGAYATAPLRNPVNDARAMARVLRVAGFEVLESVNLAEKDMRRAILQFGHRLQPGGVGLFYFAGHGIQVNGRNYLVPVDAEVRSEAEAEVEALDVARVLARMETARTRLNIVILDACRNNPFGRSFRTAVQGLAVIDAPAGTLLAYATAPGKVARDGEGAQGLYTGELLKALPIPGLSIEQVFKRVRQAVQQQTRGEQVPWESSSLVGDFVFAAAPVPIAPGPVARVEPPGPVVREELRSPRGSLAVSANIPGVEVWLGDRRLGEARPGRALVVDNLAAGTHRLRARKAGHKEWERDVQVVADARAEVAIDLERFVESLRAGAVQRRGTDGAEMAYIPRGTFTMGDAQGQGGGESVPHAVTAEGFWIDRTEVTNAQFARFIQARGTAQGDGQRAASGREQHPVAGVTWHDAVAYCRWAQKRLPTEAEWEYAARGADGRRYPWGNAWEDPRARFRGNRGNGATAPVGSYPNGASPFGLLDMAGNVWEWASTLFKPYPYVVTDGREDPGASGRRVLRGGSWMDAPGDLRSTFRDTGGPGERSATIGFRCAQTAD